MADTEKQTKLNKQIAELKKRIQIFEGQKKANSEEWEKQKQANCETISILKKEIKELTAQLTQIKNPSKYKFIAQSRNQIQQNFSEVREKIQFLVGVRHVSEAITKLDLKMIDTKKQLDLLHDKYLRRQKFFNKLVEDYNVLLAYKNIRNNCIGGPPPETLEEDTNRKLICNLENEIHRTNVKWMEAEHIRKKYRQIKASLMGESDKFEKSLRELKESLAEQQAEIRRLQRVHKEAIGMRDFAKIILQRQEQQTHSSNKTREKQALDFRRQVEERKLELERIERKLFSTGKTLMHQESIASSGDQLTGKTDQDDDPNAQLKSKTQQMEQLFKKLMEITGATTIDEVLQRFLSQKESASRLGYLRQSAEDEKKKLEQQRELLMTELEASKFTHNRDNEVNQEKLEKLKTEIADLKKQEQENYESAERIKKAIQSINDTLIEIIFKLQETDDEVEIFISRLQKMITSNDLVEFLNTEAVDEDLINIIENKIKKTLIIANQNDMENLPIEENDEEFRIEDLDIPLASPRTVSAIEEKPQTLPMCYVNLMAGRTGLSSSASPGQTSQPVVTDDESEIPSRNYLKQQALLIVDTKSRRKGFRSSTQRRK